MKINTEKDEMREEYKAIRKVKKILLVIPHSSIVFQKDGTKQIKECPLPLGLAYLSSQLRDYEVKIFDFVVEDFLNEEIVSKNIIRYGASLEQYKKFLKDFNPDLVGVSCIISNRENSVFDICKTTKKFNKEIITVIGGHHATAVPKHLLEKDIDFVVFGEGDLRFPKLIKTINEGKGLEEVDGIAYKIEKKIIIQPMIDYVRNLDELPFPAWDIIELEKYWGKLPNSHGISLKDKRFITMMTSRGCPNLCFYCAVPKHTGIRNYRRRNINKVIEEIEWLREEFKIKEIHFEDDNFLADRERIKELCRILIQKFPDMHFAIASGVDPSQLDFELIDLLKEANFHHLILGIETGDIDIQGKYVSKKIDLKNIKKIVAYMNKVGLNPSGFFLLGFPYETKQQIKNTTDLATSLNLNKFYLSMVSPLPGSRLYEFCRENDLLYDDFDFSQVHCSNTYIKNPNITREELEGIRRDVWKKYMKKKIDINQYGTNGYSKKTEKFLHKLKCAK